MLTNSPEAEGGQNLERARPSARDPSSLEALREMPALMVLEQLPAPALAVDRAGTILFANAAFCDMVGYSHAELLSIMFKKIFYRLPTNDRWIALLGTDAERLVELRHQDGHSVWASMSKSALRRRDDTVALAIFHDRTEELWITNVARGRD